MPLLGWRPAANSWSLTGPCQPGLLHGRRFRALSPTLDRPWPPARSHRRSQIKTITNSSLMQFCRAASSFKCRNFYTHVIVLVVWMIAVPEDLLLLEFLHLRGECWRHGAFRDPKRRPSSRSGKQWCRNVFPAVVFVFMQSPDTHQLEAVNRIWHQWMALN